MEFIRGDIVYVSRCDGVGHEQTFSRPAVIVSNDTGNHFSPTVEVVWLTASTKKRPNPCHCVITSAEKRSLALCEGVTTIDKTRIDRWLGHCTEEEMQRINTALRISLALDE